MNKILKLIFIVLVVLVIIEGSFFLYISILKPKSDSNAVSQSTANTVTDPKIQTDIQFTQKFRSLMENGAILSSILITKYRGKIVNLDLNKTKAVTKLGEIDIAAKIVLEYNDKTTDLYYITPSQLLNTSVSINGKPAELKDLKASDEITIEISYDQTKDYKDRITSIKIEKRL